MLLNKRKFRKRNKKIRRIVLPIFYFLLVGVVSGGVYYVHLLRSQNKSDSPTLSVSAHAPLKKDANLTLLEKSLREENLDFSSITPSNSQYIVHMQNKSDIIFSSQKDIHSQISSLQFILPRLTMEGKPFSRLDLRFDKPILTE